MTLDSEHLELSSCRAGDRALRSLACNWAYALLGTWMAGSAATVGGRLPAGEQQGAIDWGLGGRLVGGET